MAYLQGAFGQIIRLSHTSRLALEIACKSPACIELVRGFFQRTRGAYIRPVGLWPMACYVYPSSSACIMSSRWCCTTFEGACARDLCQTCRVCRVGWCDLSCASDTMPSLGACNTAIDMKPLRPVTSLALAAVLTGVVLAAIAAIVQPDTRTARGIAIFFGGGALFGLIVVAPIVAAEAFRRPSIKLLGEHAFRLNWYVSMHMGLAIGYVFASMRHHMFDLLTGVALAVVFVGAIIKTFMFTVYRADS
jgi:hypothetical protein